MSSSSEEGLHRRLIDFRVTELQAWEQYKEEEDRLASMLGFINVCICLCVYLHMYIFIYMHIHIHMYIHVCMYIYIYIYICVCLYINCDSLPRSQQGVHHVLSERLLGSCRGPGTWTSKMHGCSGRGFSKKGSLHNMCLLGVWAPGRISHGIGHAPALKRETIFIQLVTWDRKPSVEASREGPKWRNYRV